MVALRTRLHSCIAVVLSDFIDGHERTCPLRLKHFDSQNAVVIELWPGHELYQGPYADSFLQVSLV